MRTLLLSKFTIPQAISVFLKVALDLRYRLSFSPVIILAVRFKTRLISTRAATCQQLSFVASAVSDTKKHTKIGDE